MADKEAVTLLERVNTRLGAPQFKPGIPHYNRTGDFISIFLEDQDYFAERIDEVLTIYLTKDDHRLIGCKIKGISVLATNATTFLKVDLTFEMILYGATAKTPNVNKYYWELSDMIGKVGIPRELVAD